MGRMGRNFTNVYEFGGCAMNILSISQLQTQAMQSDLSQIDSAKNKESETASFAEFLRDAKKSNETEKPVVAEEAQTEKTDEVVTEKGTESNEKTEKIAKKDAPKSEKNDDNKNEAKKVDFTEGNFIAVGINQIQNARKLAEESETPQIEVAQEVSAEENSTIDDKMISWLLSRAKIEEKGEDISNEDFAQMIDAAVEFIPGFESEEEKLTTAQNLAVNDPQRFLENIISDSEVAFTRGAPKSELISDSDKKISSEKLPKEKKSDTKLAVHDLRTHHLFEDDAKIASDKIVQKSAEKKEINLSMQKQADGTVQMTMEFANRTQENITSSSSQAAGATGSDFQAMLSNAVQENAPDFVKAGNIVLKDNNQGSINLILRPEGLGNVKISLNLDDKNLSAQITVQTKEAMDAFKESIPSLKQAFTESGFDTGSFDLNFSNNQQGFAQGGNDGQNQQNAGMLAHKNYGDFVTAHTMQGDVAEAFTSGDYSVNIVA